MGSLLWDRKGLTALEALIALCLIGLLIGVLVSKSQQVTKEAQETAVRAELANIRKGITLFKIINERNPQSLNELMEKDVLLPVGSDSLFNQKYLTANAIDTKGNILDAFGNPFIYDFVSGKVRTATAGYERW